MAAKPKRRKSKDEAPTEPASTQSGGVNLDADNANIGGDVVGRDKLEAGGDIAGRDKITAGGDVIQVGAGATLVIGAPAPSAVEEAPAPGDPPFKGLQYFDEADADLFFGRELLTATLVGQLREHRFLTVVGASGSGKSSLVRAGLIPALKHGERLIDDTLPPDGSARWPIHVITPTAHPLEALAASLTRDSESVTATATLMDDLARDTRSLHLAVLRATHLRGASHVLLIVDQFEELFTLCRSDAERKAFVENLLTAAGIPSPLRERAGVRVRRSSLSLCAPTSTRTARSSTICARHWPSGRNTSAR